MTEAAALAPQWDQQIQAFWATRLLGPEGQTAKDYDLV